jgi:hypothetical protein
VQIGSITIGGRIVGSVTLLTDTLSPDSVRAPTLASYETMDAAPGSVGRSEYDPGTLPSPRHHAGPDRGDVKGAYPEVHVGNPTSVGVGRVYGRLAEARDKARQEIKDKPSLNEKAMHIFAGENDDPAAATALWEETINRAAVRGTSLEQELRHTSEGGYFAGWRDQVSPETRKVLEESRDRALNYSNVSNYATDNSSGGLAERDRESGHFTEKNFLNREHFFGPDNRIPAHQRAYHDLVNESEAGRAADPAATANAASTGVTGDETPRGSANFMRGQYGAPGSNLTRITTPSGMSATVHKEAAPSFSGFLGDLEKSGYKISDLGGYADRDKVGASGLSQHAYGNAIDINPDQNPQHGGTNLPSNVSDMAAKWGLTWGGDWSRHSRDPMHFEWTGHRPWLNAASKPHEKTAAADRPFDPETSAP